MKRDGQEMKTGWLIDRYPIDLESKYIDAPRIYSNLQYLPGIKYLAQQGYVRFYTSSLLEREKRRHPPSKFDGKIGWLIILFLNPIGEKIMLKA